MGVSTAGLGFLTAVYFLAFAFAQVPLGVALDRFGPRRVQTTMLPLAALGSLIFGVAHSEFGLIAGRFLIGLGTTSCLMAAFKTARQWYPNDRLASVNGWFVMCGAVGALVATAPLVALVHYVGWRLTFGVLAIVALLLAAFTFAVAPESPVSRIAPTAPTRVRDVLRDRMFLRLATMSALTSGTASAFQGLWAAHWFTEVERLGPDDIKTRLVLMACGLTVSAPLLGFLARRLKTRAGTGVLATLVASSLVAVESLIAVRAPIADFLTWPLLAGAGAMTVLTYSLLAEFFPETMAGRANAVFNVVHTGATFGLQCMVGVVVNRWALVDGVHPTVSYQWAIGLIIALQTKAIFSFASAYFLFQRSCSDVDACHRRVPCP